MGHYVVVDILTIAFLFALVLSIGNFLRSSVEFIARIRGRWLLGLARVTLPLNMDSLWKSSQRMQRLLLCARRAVLSNAVRHILALLLNQIHDVVDHIR